MKSQRVLFIGGVIVALGIGAWALLQKSGDDQSMMSSITDQLQEEGAMAEDGEMMEGDNAKSDDTMMNEDASSGDDALMPEKEDAMMPDAENAGQYEDYTKSAFDQAVGKRRVLFFYANWCPICRPADSDIRANVAKLPADVAVLRVNYNDTDTDSDEKALAKEYGVTYQHTFVQIDSDGNVVTKWNGGKMAELLNNIK
ncbi:MAG: redoxin domain-containing protein [Candidatus Moraniibacteriota bacterium]|nr:MAG: redoxin domain-containing protein [Candidatus Moranbacteria bacterium]